MSSRLDKLLSLLKAPAPFTRRAATQRLIEIAREHPLERFALLENLEPYLTHASSDVRLAAANALEGILTVAYEDEAVPFDLAGTSGKTLAVALDDIHVDGVLARFDTLCGSLAPQQADSGAERDVAKGRENLEQALGLNPAFGVSSQDLVDDADLKDSTQGGSASTSASTSIPPEKKIKVETEPLIKSEVKTEESFLVKLLMRHLPLSMDSAWELRHGSALVQGAFAAVLTGKREAIAEKGLLAESAISLAGILILDRFSDFRDDHVSSPVREVAAKAFGCIAAKSFMSHVDKERAMLVIREMLSQSAPWECKLSAVLCLKALGSFHVGLKLDADILELIFSLFNSGNDDLVHLVAEVAVIFKTSWREAPSHVERLLEAASRALAPGQDSDEFLVSSFLSLYHYLVTEGLVPVQDSVTDMAYLLPLLDNALQSVRRQSAELLLIKVQSSTILRSLDVESIKVLLCLAYQRILCEEVPEIQSLIAQIWGSLIANVNLTVLLGAACPCFGFWLSCLMVSPVEPVLDPTNVVSVRPLSPNRLPKLLVGGDSVMALTLPMRTEIVAKAQLLAARCLAKLVPLICEQSNNHEDLEGEAPPAESFLSVIRFHLKSNSYHQHKGCLMLLTALSEICDSAHQVNQIVRDGLRSEILNPVVTGSGVLGFEEMGLKMSEMNCVCRKLIDSLADANRSLPEPPPNAVFTAEQVLILLNTLRKLGRSQSVDEPYILQLVTEVQHTTVTVKALYAIATVRYGLASSVTNNDVIRPLFTAVKMISGDFRDLASSALADFLLVKLPEPFVVKFAQNVVIYLSDDGTKTPIKVCDPEVESSAILSSKTTEKRQHSWDSFLVVHDYVFEEGMRYFLKELCSKTCLKEHFPAFWNFAIFPSFDFDPKSRLVLQKLQFLEVIADLVACEDSFTLLRQATLLDLLYSDYPTVRHMAARAISRLVTKTASTGLNFILPLVQQELKHGTQTERMCGAVELLFILVQSLQEGLVGFYPVFVLDLLACMSNPTPSVREVAATTFASSVALLPLEIGTGPPAGMSKDLSQMREMKMEFIRKMSSPGSQEIEPVPLQLTVEPRQYQLEGVQWLMFLNEYNLNGILADDMGLGKTLMALCAVLASHTKVAAKFSQSSGDSGGKNLQKPVSLVIAPASCVGHWNAECEKLFKKESAPRILYVSSSRMAKSLETSSFVGSDLVFASYDDVRKNRSIFTALDWHYIVLDEGHVIKNPKSDLANVIFALKSRHKLLLSGTPVQNTVMELWSAFSFLMPGYLGSQTLFNAQYAKVIERSKSPKATEAQFKAADKALEALHKRTLPFILRRLKTNVLKDLPPKIIQDFYCDLSPKQRDLYDAEMEKFRISREKGEKVSALSLIRYLRLLCDHPRLVDNQIGRQPEISGKLAAFREILNQCGIGVDEGENPANDILKPHRALVFCQFKSVISLLAEQLGNGEYGKVSHLKLDGSVPPAQRQSVVNQFNSDPSVDLLLLTTQVGGLGLSLTAADTVIFIDQDWNPARDLQAMDRAHRLGQKHAVMVYRIVTRDTIEERIQKLQLQKRHIAETVVDSANQSLQTMATDQLLDLLEIGDKTERPAAEGDIEQLWNFEA